MNPMGLYYLHLPSFTKINHPVSRIYKFQGHLYLYILVGFMYMGYLPMHVTMEINQM